MKKLFIIFSIIPLFLFNSSIMANNAYSQVATNLQFFIQPKQENEAGYLKTKKVCECVAQKVFENWTKEQFSSFDKELNEHVAKTTEALKDIENLMTNGLPEQTESLNKSLKNSIEFVQACEKEVGTEVEF